MLSTMIALPLLLAGSSGGANNDAYVQLVPNEQLTHILVVNQSDRSLQLWASFSTHSMNGRLTLEFSQGERKFQKQFEGYPAGGSDSVFVLLPGAVYGLSYPTDYLRRVYRLSPGCYDVTINLQLPQQSGAIGAGEISTTQRDVCFSTNGVDGGA